jgi:RNA polymerase sigma factor (sigma-70 family)
VDNLSPSSIYNEQQLFQKIASGDEQAFRQVVHLYYPKLLGFVFKMTKTRHTAEELVQEVFLKLWQKRNETDIQNLGAWLHTVASNLTINYLRKLARENRLFSEMKKSSVFSTDSTSEMLDLHDSVDLLQKALDQLPPQQKKIYVLSQIEGLSREEISERLNSPESNQICT